jgi:hypothetical protein
VGFLQAAAVAGALSALAALPASAQQPLGIVDQTLGRFDPDTLEPVGPAIEVVEPHAAPALSPAGERFAIGVSEPPGPDARTSRRVGLWIVDPARMEVVHRVQTGIAVEAVAYPGVVAALAQDGSLLVVDGDTGAIVRRRRVGFSHCGPGAVVVGGVAVFVNQIHARSVELATVGAAGRIRRLRIPMPGGGAARDGCRRAALVADAARGRVLVAGATRVAAVDVASLRVRAHAIGDRAAIRSAALLPGRLLAVAGERGLRVLDLRSWRLRWRDRGARSVLAGGSTVVAIGRTGVRARDAATGRLRWRAGARDGFAAVAAGRLYLQTPRAVRVHDLATGWEVARRPPVLSRIRFAQGG